MNFPPPPTDSVDWENLGVGVTEVNGHCESRYSLETGVWSPPRLAKDPVLRIHGLAPGLNYGQQCLEGMKAYRTADGKINIFRVPNHAARLSTSSSTISIPPIPTAHFTLSVHLAVSLNAAFVPPHNTNAFLYIRPLVFGSSGHLGLTPPTEYTFCIYVIPVTSYHGTHPLKALILEDFDRAAPKGVGSAKVGGNYAPVMRWSGKAKEMGYGITLHLDSKTRSEIEEFSTSGFIGVKRVGVGEEEGVVMVVPDSENALRSVTSESCVEIARSWGWKVEIRAIPYEELQSFTEVFAVGTAAAVVPIRSITMESTADIFLYGEGDNEPGPCCVKLTKALQDIQRGNAEDKFGWLDQVHTPESYEVSDS